MRNRLLASPRFQAWALRSVLTRPLARRHSARLFDLCAGFVYSQILWTCVRLGLLEVLAAAPRSLAQLSAQLELAPQRAARLLAAAGALRLVTPQGSERFVLGPLGAMLLGTPGLRAMIEHHSLLYADLADPVALLRTSRSPTRLAGYWAYASTDVPGALAEDATRDYTALMSASQPLIAQNVLAAYSLSRHRHLLDVGGGDGAFAAAAATAAPDLQVSLIDLPPVAARANARFARLGLAQRVRACGGDFHADPLPQGADIVSLVRVLHDHDDDAVLSLLRGVRAALPRDGRVLIAEPLAGDSKVADAYFSMYLLAMGHGRVRTQRELGQLLAACGFAMIAAPATALPALVRVLIARCV